MGLEVTDTCMEKEQGGTMSYSDGVSPDSSYLRDGNQDVLQSSEYGVQRTDMLNENVEIKEHEVKDCTAEMSDESKQEQDRPSSKVKDDNGRSRASVKSITKSVAGSCKTKCTVPQPFALATERRASHGTRPVRNDAGDVSAVQKPSETNNLQAPRSVQNQVIPLCFMCFFTTIYWIMSLKGEDESKALDLAKDSPHVLFCFCFWLMRKLTFH